MLQQKRLLEYCKFFSGGRNIYEQWKSFIIAWLSVCLATLSHGGNTSATNVSGLYRRKINVCIVVVARNPTISVRNSFSILPDLWHGFQFSNNKILTLFKIELKMLKLLVNEQFIQQMLIKLISLPKKCLAKIKTHLNASNRYCHSISFQKTLVHQVRRERKRKRRQR